MIIINMINGLFRFDSTISIRATPSYSRATTFDFQHDVQPSDADDVISFHHH
jgi:hypothetical protein